MAIQRSTDSMSTCNPDLYDNIYRVDKRADFKVDLKPGSKDTIERSLSKEALDRLERPSKDTIVQPGFLFRRIGKYVFLSVALPPYVLLYGIPKWLLVEAFPILLSGFTFLMKIVKDRLEKPFNKIVQTLNQIVLFMQMLSKRILKPVAKLTIEIRQFFQKFKNGTSHFFERLNRNALSALKKPGAMLSHLFRRTKEKLTDGHEWISEKLEFAQQKVKEGLNWIKNSPQLLAGWGSSKILNLINLQANWRSKFSFKFERSRNLARECSQWVGRRLNGMKQVISRCLSPFAKFYQNSARPLFNFIVKTVGGNLKKMSEFFGGRKKKILEYLLDVQKRIKLATPHQALERMFSQTFLSKLPLLIRKFLLAIKQNALFKACFQICFNAGAFVLFQIAKGITSIIGVFSQTADKISEIYCKVKSNLASKSQALKVGMGSCLNYFRRGWERTFYGFLVLVIMSAYLASWGFEWVGEITAYYLSKFSLRKNNL